jgi:excisionase family DNA binding protein
MPDAAPDAFAPQPIDPAESGDRRRWFTVRDAADYLGVSRPTIFRWMKEGALSFYKVGGSTRFTRGVLDAVIEKTTGRKEAEAAAGRCTACGHDGLVSGRLQGMGKLYFRPDHARFWTLRESLVGTRVRACPACGRLHLFADTGAMEKLSPSEPGPAEADDRAEGAPDEQDARIPPARVEETGSGSVHKRR